MKSLGGKAWILGVLAAWCAIPGAQAQWAVVDVGAIAQLIKEVATLEQQLQTAENQLTQAQQAYQSMTGSRGMQNLLSGTVRNYLPPDWPTVVSAVNGRGGPYGALSASIQSNVTANAILTPAELAVMSPTQQSYLTSQRSNIALLQALTQQALSATSNRFGGLQTLISTIGGANDPKAVADLQARIQAEQSMLVTDQSKLATLYQAAQAQQAALEVRLREQAIADGGSLRQLPAMGLR